MIEPLYVCFFFFNDTATTEIYTLSLHDALPIYRNGWPVIAAKTASTMPPARRNRGLPGRGGGDPSRHDSAVGDTPGTRKHSRLGAVAGEADARNRRAARIVSARTVV